jgi:phage N-6-adenine-methyltransferase
MEYRPHPLADIFPLMSGDEFVSLKEDIKANGLIEPIWTLDGLLLDGRNRFKACQEVGVQPIFREYQGENPTAFVISLNLKRRHLNESQRAMVAAKLANMRQGERTDIEPSANLQKVSQGEAADLLNVGTRSVASAKKVEEKGSPELVAAVEEGKISVSTAADLTETPVETQIYAAENPKEAPAIVHNHRAQGTGENEWYTPEQHIVSASQVLGGIALDPATSELANKVVKAENIFTQEDNGLAKPWHGTVWLNPPYSQPAISQFAEKLASEWESGRLTGAIALTHNYTDTQWFHRLAKACTAICFTKGRIGFVNPEGKKAAPTQGQSFFYFGDKPEDFAEEFSKHGFVVEVCRGV